MSSTVDDLVRHFEAISRDRMRGLPIVNPAIRVEAVDFQPWEGREVGVLISPWFINLVLLPGIEEWTADEQGKRIAIAFPSGACDMTVCHDEVLGVYLSAVLFRSVMDFPSQEIASAVASEALAQIMSAAVPEGRISRRQVFTGLRAS